MHYDEIFSSLSSRTRNRRTANRALRAYFTSMDKIRSVANARKVGNIIETDMVQRRRNKELKLNQIKNVVRSITNVGAMDILHGDGVPPGGKLRFRPNLARRLQAARTRGRRGIGVLISWH